MEEKKDMNETEKLEIKKPAESVSEPEVIAKNEEKKPENIINFKDFGKVEMVVALVLEAEKHENADRLLKLEIDTGEDKRTLVAGVAEHYAPEELIGKKIIIVKNLKPAKIRGVKSQGMILAASGPDGRPYIPIIPEETPVGAKLK